MPEYRGDEFGSTGRGGGAGSEPWYARENPTEPDWRELFLGGGPAEILDRIEPDDPLALVQLCEDWLSDNAVLVHPDRLFVRAVARVAYAAAYGYDGRPSLLNWLLLRIDQSLQELMEEDFEEERFGIPPSGVDLDRYMDLIPRETGIEPALTRRACVIFNALSKSMREPFYRTVIENWTPEEFAMQKDRSLDEVVRQIQETTRHLVFSVENGEYGKEDEGR